MEIFKFLKGYSHNIFKKVQNFQNSATPVLHFSLYHHMAFKHFQSSWVLCDWPHGSVSLLYAYLLKIRGQTFWELILPKEASVTQIIDLT